MDRKTDYEPVIYDTPEPAKNDTLEQVKIATPSKTDHKLVIFNTPEPAKNATLVQVKIAISSKTDHKLVIFNAPEPAKNDTLVQVKIAISSKTISVSSAPSPTPRNTGNTEKLNKLLQLAIRVENI